MARHISGETKTYNVKRTLKNGVIYMYQRTEKYDPVSRHMKKTAKDVLIGKILPSEPGMIVPTRPRAGTASTTQAVDQPQYDADRGRNGAVDGDQRGSDGALTLSARRHHMGAGRLLDRAAELCGIEDDIYALTDKGTAQKLISCARFLVSTGGDRLSHIATWQVMHPIPYADGLSKDICHRLTQSLGVDETFRQSLFQKRFDRQSGEGSLVVAFDGSTVSTYSENQVDARYGYNKDGDGLPTIKWLAFYASESCEPLAFAKQPGNVPDVVSVTNAMSQLSVLTTRRVVLVTDNGFYSEANAHELMFQGFGFLMRIEAETKWVRKYLGKHLWELESSRCSCSEDGYVTGVTVQVVRSFEKIGEDGSTQSIRKKCHLHFFLDSRKRAAMNAAGNVELQELKLRLDGGVPYDSLSRAAQKKVDQFFRRGKGYDGKERFSFNDEAIRKSRETNGIFAVLGFGAEEEVRDTRRAFATYINREHIENYFRAEKQTVDGNAVRSWYGDNYMGRMVIQFVALCYEDCLWQRIKSIKKELRAEIVGSAASGKDKTEAGKKQKLLTWLDGMSLRDIICWFDAIEVTEVSAQIRQRRWNTEVLERDRMFLELMGIKFNT